MFIDLPFDRQLAEIDFDPDHMVRQVEHELLRPGICIPGDTVVIVAGSPPLTPGRINALRVHRIGDAVTAS